MPGAAAADEVGGERDAVGEAGARRAEVEGAGAAGPERGGDGGGRAGDGVGERAGGDQDQADVGGVDAGGGERLATRGHGHLDDGLALAGDARG